MPRSSRTALRALVPACLVAAWLQACTAPPLAEGGALDASHPPAPEVRRHLTYDDVLRIEVLGHPELSSGEPGRRVDHDGNVDLPLLGPVRVVGLTVEEARAALHGRAAEFLREPSIAVSVQSYAPRLFHVLGEVNQSGSYSLDRPTTALTALGRAGGLTQDADGEEVTLLRIEDDELVVRVFNAATPGPDGLLPIRPDDLVFVRADGTGTFRQQILPYIEGLSGPLAVAVSALAFSND